MVGMIYTASHLRISGFSLGSIVGCRTVSKWTPRGMWYVLPSYLSVLTLSYLSDFTDFAALTLQCMKAIEQS